MVLISYVILTLFFICLTVTTCCLAREALSLLRERKDGFDIVISDVNMPDMDGFKLLEHVGLEMDLPVISQFSIHKYIKLSLLNESPCSDKLHFVMLHSDVCRWRNKEGDERRSAWSM